jgi:hypothetical protein
VTSLRSGSAGTAQTDHLPATFPSKRSACTPSSCLDEIVETYTLGPEHRALVALTRAALSRWAEVKEQLDAMAGAFETPGRYTGSTRTTPLLAQEVNLRAAVLLSVEKIARLLG